MLSSSAALSCLASGGIVAIKGLGGFHLACDAAITSRRWPELRRRKRRSNKPLAVMVRSLADTERLCHIDDAERDRSPAVSAPSCRCAGALLARTTAVPRHPRPRAICRARPARARRHASLPRFSICCLLPRQKPAVCTRSSATSGNLSEEPIETDDDLAWESPAVAAGIADALLGNDRAILLALDDSVVRVVDGAAMPVRRARGYAPQPLPLPALDGVPSCVLACGPQQKATIVLTREGTNGEATCFCVAAYRRC